MIEPQTKTTKLNTSVYSNGDTHKQRLHRYDNSYTTFKIVSILSGPSLVSGVLHQTKYGG